VAAKLVTLEYCGNWDKTVSRTSGQHNLELRCGRLKASAPCDEIVGREILLDFGYLGPTGPISKFGFAGRTRHCHSPASRTHNKQSNWLYLSKIFNRLSFLVVISWLIISLRLICPSLSPRVLLPLNQMCCTEGATGSCGPADWSGRRTAQWVQIIVTNIRMQLPR
jgi:hypothetical protein